MPGRVGFLEDHQGVAVRAVVNDSHALRMLVDTGAAYTVIGEDIAKTKNITLSGPLHRTPLVTMESLTSPVAVGRLGTVQVGTTRAEGVMALIAPLPAALAVDGILGLSFLRNYRVTFEFDTSSLVLREFAAGRPVITGA